MATVLIVDDDDDVRMFLRVALEAAGFTTISAANGQEAVVAIVAREPDVVIPRHHDARGRRMGRPGRGTRRRGQPPVIVMTAKADAETRDRAHQLGVEGFVTKPFYPDEMLRRVEDILRHARNPLAIRIGP